MQNDEQLIAIVSFAGAIKREIMKVKRELEKCEGVSAFRLDIEAQGRVSEGDIEIKFRLGEIYGDSQVIGNDWAAVTEEFIRRHSWKKRHAPLRLTTSEQEWSDSSKLPPKESDSPF